ISPLGPGHLVPSKAHRGRPEPGQRVSCESPVAPMSVQSKERTLLAHEVVRLLLKAHKMRKLYAADHAYCVAVIKELGASIRSFVTLYEPLRLDVTRDALLFGDQRLYEEPNREANIAFGAFLGGVRGISFGEGITDAELLDFLGI